MDAAITYWRDGDLAGGARHVTVCELSAPLAEAARRVIEENRFGEKVTAIAEPSTSTRIGDDLPKRADLLVSEILDSGLSG